MNKIKIILLFICIFLSPVALFGKDAYIPFGNDSIKGKPTFYISKSIAYYLWNEGNIVHIRWSSDSTEHVFQGKITADTPITNIVRVATEQGDYVVQSSKYAVVFSSATSISMDGFSFQLNNPTKVKFLLSVDNKLIDSTCINLGSSNTHPEGNPLFFYKP